MNHSSTSQLPPSITLDQHDNYMHITRRWYDWRAIALTAVTLLVGVGIFGLYDNNPLGEESDALLVLVHSVLTIGLAYYSAASWLNSTHIFVSQEAIAVKHQPLPWLGQCRVETANITQLYTYKKEVVNRNGESKPLNDKTVRPSDTKRISYQVRILDSRQQTTVLLEGLPSQEQAQFIEKAIEGYLQISDKSVKGEVA